MMKEKIQTAVQAMEPELSQLADRIFDFNEHAFEEHQSCALLEEFLGRHGFTVEHGVAEIDTAFRAVYEQGTGGPSIGLLAEYDALEGIGHACGHHMQGPSVIGAALAVQQLCKDIPYKLVVYGTPAEETVGGKILMQERGCFKDIDLALMMHAAPTTCVDVKCMALEDFIVTFHGVKSHAAISPDQGRSAFDAAMLSFQGIEFLREHVRDDTRMHYTVLDAGGPANVVPDKAVAEYTLRSYDTPYLDSVVERFHNVLKGACLMTGTTYECERSYPFRAKIPCYRLNDLIMENARYFQAPQLAPPREKTGSTDFGNVMYEVPGSCIRVAFVPAGTSPHSKDYLDAGKTGKAHEAVCHGARILAGTIVDLLEKPEILAEIRKEFAERKGQG